MPLPPRFCPQCGVQLSSPDACDRCEWVYYRDPKLAVVVLVADADGRLLYVRRNHEPAMHQWSWPSGFVDAGERVEHAAAREVREETGVKVEVGELLGVWSAAGEQVVVVAYCARAVGGALRPGPEATAAAWFPLAPDAPPRPHAFPHDAEILDAYRTANRASLRRPER